MKNRFRRSIAWLCLTALLTGSVSSYSAAGEVQPEEAAGSAQLLEEITLETMQIVTAAGEDFLDPEEELFAETLEDPGLDAAYADAEKGVLLDEAGDDLIEEDPADLFLEEPGDAFPEEIPDDVEEAADLFAEDPADTSAEDPADLSVGEAADGSVEAEPETEDSAYTVPEAGDDPDAEPETEEPAEEASEDPVFAEPETEDLYVLEEIEVETEEDLLLCEEAEEDAADAAEVSLADFSYYIEEGNYIAITGYHGKEKRLVIPQELDGYTVVAVTGWEDENEVTYLELPNTVYRIGEEAFRYDDQLEMINLGSGLNQIERQAFRGTSALRSIAITGNCEFIDEMAFYGSSITTLTIGAGSEAMIDWQAFAYSKLESILFIPQEDPDGPDSSIEIGREAFYHCSNLKELELDGVDEIGPSAFACCGLTNVQVLCDLYRIPACAFAENESLISVSFKNVTTIEYGAFRFCTNLERILVPDDLEAMNVSANGGDIEQIGPEAVRGTKWLSDQGAGAVVLGDLLYAYNGEIPNGGSYAVPEGVAKINAAAFKGQMGLTSLTIPATVKKIGFCAFLDCHFLHEVEIPETVEDIEPYAFGFKLGNYNDILASYKGGYANYIVKDPSFIIKGVPYSEAWYYANDYGFTFLDVTQNPSDDLFKYVIDDDGNAVITGFKDGPDVTMKTLDIPEEIDGYTVVGIGMNAFRESSIYELRIPASVKKIGPSAFWRSRVKSVQFASGSSVEIGDHAFALSYAVNLDFPEDGSITLGTSAFAGCQDLKYLELNGVVQIGSYAFSDCPELEYVNTGNKLTTIAQEAFRQDRKLHTVEMKAVTTIEYAAFSYCARLGSITFPKKLNKIDREAFRSTRWYDSMAPGPVYQSGVLYNYKGQAPAAFTIMNGTEVISACAVSGKPSLAKVTIPLSVKEIGFEAFCSNASLKHVLIPETVTTIGKYAFGYQAVAKSAGGIAAVYNNMRINYVRKIDGFTIFGKPGSAAHKYASENGFAFYDASYYGKNPGVKLNFSGILPMKVGQTCSEVKAVCTLPYDSIDRWVSSNPLVVKVHNTTGKLTAVKVGKAVVTVYSKLGGKASFKVEVFRKKGKIIKTTKLKLEKPEVLKKGTLKKGKSAKLNPTRFPFTSDEKITYKSSNSKIVSVTKNGKIKARKKGKAKITIKSGKKKVTITINVK